MEDEGGWGGCREKFCVRKEKEKKAKGGREEGGGRRK